MKTVTKNILITGPTNGIGRDTALALAKQGHRLFLLCRNPQAAEQLCQQIALIEGAQQAVPLIADLEDTASIEAACEQFLALDQPLDMLINNAGIMNTSRQTTAVNGHEVEQMLAVNYLGPYLLTRLLLPCLLATAEQQGTQSRLVIVSSEAHALFCKKLSFDDFAHQRKYSSIRAYGESKLANLLMMRSLVERVNPALLQINALHPGAVKSNLGKQNQVWYSGIVSWLTGLFFISSEQGAETTVFLATAAIDTQGDYYYRSKPHRLKPWAKDDHAAERLWQYSESLLALPTLGRVQANN
jgi:NAD(P)-dependent dehydrogenase (short-subunit alcohol dehydrogenase family)